MTIFLILFYPQWNDAYFYTFHFIWYLIIQMYYWINVLLLLNDCIVHVIHDDDT